jgi:hypothetical protein
MSIWVNASVRVHSRCSLNGRTGVVTEFPEKWPGWARVELDPVEGTASWEIGRAHV